MTWFASRGNVPNILTKKVGPLPVWAWGAITVTGVILARRWSQSRAVDSGESEGGGLGVVGVGSAIALPATPPPPLMESLFVSFPWGEGYVSVEGGAEAVTGILGGIPLQGATTTAPTNTTPTPVVPGGDPILSGYWNLQLLSNGSWYNHNYATQSECEALRASLSSPELYRCGQT